MPDAHPLAIVTGGTSGIGWEIACALAADGMRVLIIGRDSVKWDSRRADLPRRLSSNVMFESVDVQDRHALKACLDHAIITFGTPRWVVACAGICEPGHFLALSAEAHETQWNTNYCGVLHTIRGCAPAMVAARAGHIVLISSAGVFGAFHGYSAYNPSKAAIASLGDILYLELASLGIKVTTVFPPDTDTPQLQGEKSKRPFVAARFLEGMPVMSPKRVAHDILVAARAGRRHAVPGLGTRLFQMFPGLFGAVFRRRQLRLARIDPDAGHR